MLRKLDIKKYIKRRRRTLITLGLVLLAYIFIFGSHGFIRILILRKKIRDTERQTTTSLAIREALTADKNSLESDRVRLEKVIRETYGMIKEGERCTLKLK